MTRIRIKHKKLKICFDSGHKNFITPNLAVLENYGEFVEVLHLHDNHGLSDEHLICGQGTIDWENFAANLKTNIVLSAEVKYGEKADESFLPAVLEGLYMVENLVASNSKK